ncbi:MAG: alpha/beta hydrolase [Deltaproteobacteria bacterium]|nr:MAG: alpha/beta hydrolase [Deltaproteobacteria bacterium]
MKTNDPVIRSQDLGDADLQYLFYDGDGPTIILLHATGFLPWLWHPIARELSGSYKIIAPYFCDHRETDPTKGGLSWMKLADDLCQLCTRLQIKRPFLVGHSMGATVMAMAEAVYGPKAAGIILIEPIFLPRDFYKIQIAVEDHPLAGKSIKRRNFWNNASEARNYLKSKGLFKNWDDEMLDLYIKYGMVPGETGGLQLTCPPQKEASLFMGGMPYDPWPMLPKVSCPVKVIEGQNSANRSVIDLKKAASLFPRASYQLIAGAGHLIPMEKPKEMVDIIAKFFAYII